MFKRINHEGTVDQSSRYFSATPRSLTFNFRNVAMTRAKTRRAGALMFEASFTVGGSKVSRSTGTNPNQALNAVAYYRGTRT